MRKLFYIVIFLSLVSASRGQDLTAARYEIDAKRIGVDPSEKDALPRSREFIRLDSTYYVGWMYEGMYKFERSSDLLGYRNALVPLRKALFLFERDFGGRMHNLYSSYSFFQQNLSRFDDFYTIANTLKICYNSIEMPDSVMNLLDRIESYQFQKDFFSVWTERSWIYHRNRFFTSKQHPYLKNSVEENEALAFQACYRQIGEIQRNKSVNDQWYGVYQSDEDLMTVYHYLALLHNYNRRYDSADHYYNILAEGGRISWSNYANMQHEIGNFADAIGYYRKPQFRGRFSLEEADYYLPMMLIYGAKTKEALRISRQKIDARGSTPGFGWYNIALARGYLYDNQLDSCEFFLNKAAGFRELHIGTTLTQSQYEFTINLLRIQLLDRKVKRVSFLNSGWWHSPASLYELFLLKAEKLLLEYNVVNALANNPERTRIVYDLFCAETTVTYDESMYLLKDFSLPFFRKLYTGYALNDIRLKINRYFRYYEAKFLFEDGDEERAAENAESLLAEILPRTGTSADIPQHVDLPNEKLLLARIYEILAQGHGDESLRRDYAARLYMVFPQLIPSTDIRFAFRLKTSGSEDAVTMKVTEELKDCNIDFSGKETDPLAELQFEKRGDAYICTVNVTDEFGNETVKDERLIFKKGEGIGKEIALRLFGKGGAVKF